MKLRFDSDLEHQKEAVAAAVNVFEGQNIQQDDCSPIKQNWSGELSSGLQHSELGVANTLRIEDNRILENVRKIQGQNDVPQSDNYLEGGNYKFPNFTIEMETGTGKTYVYLRSIFELNRQYGFKKFIIVVPSVAIREGVLKSLQITKEHFSKIYDQVSYDYFVYNSSKLGQVRQFAAGNAVQIMVINIDAFRGGKDSRIFNQERDGLSGRKPLEFVASSRPILIIDEPQSVDNTSASQEAIQTLNPLCAFRYSATHKNFYHLLYKLDPVKAYDLRLVKRIEVNSVQSEDNFNMPYVRLDEVKYGKGARKPHAKITIHVDGPSGSKAKKIKITHGQDLASKSDRPDYAHGFAVCGISAVPESEHIEFANKTTLHLGEEIGGMREEITKAQIRDTIEIHLERENRLKKQGIKVLSLFFIDKVANYRIYSNDGSFQKGRFAKWFEEIYAELSKNPKYKGVLPYDPEEVHSGYFSQDKKGFKDTRGTTKADEDTYNLIMRDKERLLDIKEPLRFLFSHSALKEGWDNPNVFQICTLREIGSETERRQTIGRGLRLPVNQNGERVFEDNINCLTVVANESFEDYAKALQADIERDTGIKFGRVRPTAFSNIIFPSTKETIGQEESERIYKELQKQGYLNTEGKIQDKFAPKMPGFVLDLADEFKPMREAIIDEMNRYLFKNRVANFRERKRVKYRKEAELNPDFLELWKRINKKTFYSVKYDTKDLIDKAIESIGEMEKIHPVQIVRSRTEMDITKAGVEAGRFLDESASDAQAQKQIPDIIAFLLRKTQLTRDTLCKILMRSKRLKEFSINPQAFMTEVAKRINDTIHNMVVKGIKYEKVEDEVYEIKLFEKEDEKYLGEYLNQLYEVQNPCKTTHNYVHYDSEVEKDFAEKFDSVDRVRFFVKLPPWFKVPTPIGDYNPDWAFVFGEDDKVYLVRETKSTKDEGKHRNQENDKIKYGKKHFKAINVNFKDCTNVQEVFRELET